MLYMHIYWQLLCMLFALGNLPSRPMPCVTFGLQPLKLKEGEISRAQTASGTKANRDCLKYKHATKQRTTASYVQKGHPSRLNHTLAMCMGNGVRKTHDLPNNFSLSSQIFSIKQQPFATHTISVCCIQSAVSPESNTHEK